jgi:hypothetical protein
LSRVAGCGERRACPAGWQYKKNCGNSDGVENDFSACRKKEGGFIYIKQTRTAEEHTQTINNYGG